MIYLVTNRKLAAEKYFKVIEAASRSGIDGIILREKDLGFKEYYELARKVKSITSSYSTPIFLNGSLDVAKAIKADAYHSSYEEFLRSGKKYFKHGVSVHSLEEAIKAEKLGADYLLVGHVFDTDCKKGLPGRGIGFIREIRNSVEIPVIAIGGINEENIGILKENGIDKVALMSYIMCSSNIEVDILKLKESQNI